MNDRYSRKSYVRLFNNPKNVEKAIFLLNEGYSYNSIARILDCDHTSVMAFKKRQIEKGVKFKNFTSCDQLIDDFVVEFKPEEPKKEEKPPEKYEKVNRGRDYADYLVGYKEKMSKIKDKNMEKARKTIEMAKKRRAEEDLTPREIEETR